LVSTWISSWTNRESKAIWMGEALHYFESDSTTSDVAKYIKGDQAKSTVTYGLHSDPKSDCDAD